MVSKKGFDKITSSDFRLIERRLNYMHVELPKFEKNNIGILSRAAFSIDVQYTKGVCELKLKKGELSYLKKTMPGSTEILNEVQAHMGTVFEDYKYKIMYGKICLDELYNIPQKLDNKLNDNF